MTKLKTLDDLKDLSAYKKDLKTDLAQLKENPTALSWVEMFTFNGGKREAAVLLGPVPDELEKAIKGSGKAIKTGKCKRNDRKEVEIISGGLKPGLLTALFKTLGLDEQVCETVGGGGGGIDDETAEAVGKMVKQADKTTEEGLSRTADKLTDLYESLQKKYGTVFDEAKRRQFPTDALIKAELDIEKALKRTSSEIAANKDALKRQILDYDQIGKSLVEMIQRERNQELADKDNARVADELTDTFEALQKKFGTVFDEAKRLDLATGSLVEAEVKVEGMLKQTSGTIVTNAEEVRKAILAYGLAGKALASAIADHTKQEEEKKREREDQQRKQDERDRQLMEGFGKKKAATSDTRARSQQGTNAKFKPLDLGTPMTFKEKFAKKMVRKLDRVQKEVTGFDKDKDGNVVGFSTFYFFVQGADETKPDYEIHIHRNLAGAYRSGQVKFGRLAAVVKGGEADISAAEMKTYGIPKSETPP